MEFIFELIVTYLFSYPGALLRWMILKMFNSKITFEECLKQDITQNAAIGFLFLVVLFVFVQFVAT